MQKLESASYDCGEQHTDVFNCIIKQATAQPDFCLSICQGDLAVHLLDPLKGEMKGQQSHWDELLKQQITSG